MPKYMVSIPVAGEIQVFVEAKDESEAEEKAWERADFRITADYPDVEIGEFETLHTIVQGNVFYGPLNNITVELDDSP